jgi:hypothetical protein
VPRTVGLLTKQLLIVRIVLSGYTLTRNTSIRLTHLIIIIIAKELLCFDGSCPCAARYAYKGADQYVTTFMSLPSVIELINDVGSIVG